MNRDKCLLHDEGLRVAISSLVARLEGDYFKNGLRACSECSTCSDRRTAIHVHAQLKTTYDVLSSIRDLLEKLRQHETPQQ